MTIKRRKFQLGILTKPTTTAATLEGELYANSSSLTFKVYIDGAERDLLTADQAQTITNKSVDADNNTITNLETDNLKAGVLVTTISAATSDTELPSALAVKTALAGQNEASEITYDNATSGLTATDVQAAVDETEGRLDTAETNIGNNATAVSDHLADAIDAHDASAISNVPAGNLAATEVQAALNELQTDVDSRALDSALTAHTGDAVDAHDASAISNVPSGNLAATDVQAALNELQTELDSVATSTDLSNHESDTSTHGVTTVAGLDETQTFTNKTLTSPDINTPDIDGGTASNSSRIKLPTDTTTNLDALTDVESLFAYDSTKKKPVFNDGSGWNEVGSGAGGGINYILNPDAEVDTTGWATYDNGAVAIPTDGTTGSATSNYNRNTTSPLRGSGDFVFQKSTANVQGEGFSYDFIVDNADQAKKLLVSFDYDASDALYVDDDMGIFIYDVTNANLIRVNGEDLKAGKGTHYAQFQTAPDSVSYRLIVHQVSTNAGDVDVFFDNVQVGPQKIAYGTVQKDSIAFTPTLTSSGGGDITLNATSKTDPNGFYNRVGDHANMTISFRNGSGGAATGNAGSIYIGTPSYLSIDLNKLAANVGGIRVVGYGDFYNPENKITVTAIGPNTLVLTDDAGNYLDVSDIGVSDLLSINIKVPIQGWSSNAKMSEDFGGRDVIVEGAGNSASVLTANTERIDFTETRDTTASWSTVDNGTDTFTVPETGEYVVDGSVFITTGNSSMQVRLYKNGIYEKMVGTNNTSIIIPISSTFSANKGDLIDFRLNIGDTLQNDTAAHHIHIQKLASSQQILETETVAARYTSNSGQSIPNNTVTILDFEDLSYDTHNAVTTGAAWKFSPPATGIYDVNAHAALNASASLVSPEFLRIDLYKNGSLYSSLSYNDTSWKADATTMSIQGSDSIELSPEDYIDIRISQNSGVAITMVSGSEHNHVSVKRIK